MCISDWSSDVCSSDLPKGNCRYSEKASFSCDGVQLPSVGNCVLKVSVGIGRAPASGTWTILPGWVRRACPTAAFVPGPALRWCNALRTLVRSEEHTSELQSLMRISYAVFCLKKKHNY